MNFDYIYKKTSPSTNLEIKELAKEGAIEGTVLVAEHQTAGRGRLGKTFYSPKDKGVYFSLLLKPSFSVEYASFVTVAAAVAVRRAVKSLFSVETQIKWVNDLYFDGKKFCGILTESAFGKDGEMEYAVLGIGINLTEPEEGYPEEFSYKTTCLSNFVEREIEKKTLIEEILKEFATLYQNIAQKAYLSEYKSASCVIGKEIEILSGAYKGRATAIDIDDEANLVCRLENGEIVTLGTGDVSIHL